MAEPEEQPDAEEEIARDMPGELEGRGVDEEPDVGDDEAADAG